MISKIAADWSKVHSRSFQIIPLYEEFPAWPIRELNKELLAEYIKPSFLLH